MKGTRRSILIAAFIIAASALAWGAQLPTAEVQTRAGVAIAAAEAAPVVPVPDPVRLKDIGAAWEVMAPMPAGRVFNAVVASGAFIFVIGGASDAGGTTAADTVYRYDTAADTWSTMTAMPAALSQIDGIDIGGVIYIPGNSSDANTYAYNVAGDSWSTIAANNGYTGRDQYQVVAIGSDLYVLGGIVAGAATTAVSILDTLTNTWSAGVAMQEPRISFGAAAIDGSIYVAGGVNFPGFTPTMTAEAFNGSTWNYVASVPSGGGAYTRWSYNADGVGQDGLWLGAGRRDAGWTVLNHAAYYDPDTDTWTDSPTVPTLNQGRVYMEGAVGNDGYFYVIGGRDPSGITVYADNERLATNGPIPVELQSLVVE